MEFEIRHITIGELENFVSSQEYLSNSFVPISVIRAISHVHNPRADKDDVALILAYHDEKFIGYLGAIPEKLFIKNSIHKVCWYSCMWVLPEYRRRRIAKLLLEDASKKFDNNVFITNYIPRSKNAFLKNDQFSEVEVLQGIRAYLKLDLEQIITRKIPGLKWIKFLFWFIDTICNFLLTIYFKNKLNNSTDYQFERLDIIDQESAEFIEAFMQNSIFKRGAKELNWLFQFPWVDSQRPENIDVSKYYFSQYSIDFKQWILQVRNHKNEIKGIAILTKHKRELKTPYIFAHDDVIEDLFRYVYRFMLEEKIRTLVTHHAGFTKEAKRNRKAFLFQRPSKYGFMATPELVEVVHGNFGQFYEGDGDGMFT